MPQKGKLVIVDHSRGLEQNSGLEYVARLTGWQAWSPTSEHPPFDYYPMTAFGQIGPVWQYPFAFDESHYLVTFNPEGHYFYKGPSIRRWPRII